MDGVKGFCDPTKQHDLEYLEAAATGMLAFALFIDSTEDHHVGTQTSTPVVNVEEIQLDVALRYRRSRLLKRASRSGHIPWAIPDLSDLEGTTEPD